MRKKIIFSLITAVSILLTVMSCDANLDLPAYSPDKILVMNGEVSTADTVHTIRLVGSSSSEGLFGVPDATVSIFVNDLLAFFSADVRLDQRLRRRDRGKPLVPKDDVRFRQRLFDFCRFDSFCSSVSG